MTILVTGSRGMLGSSFLEMTPGAIGAGREDFDPAQPATVAAFLTRHAPQIVINCAANVDAEATEVDIAPALAANAVLPALLARYCADNGALLVQFSSTGCYGDWKEGGKPYVETDPLRPTTAHHRTKVMGEENVRRSGARSLIVRTGWLFGGGTEHKKNFVWKRLCEAADNPRMISDTHQRGNPTFVRDVVAQTFALIEAGVSGVFNCIGGGGASRFEYVQAIVDMGRLSCELTPGGPFQRLAAVSPNETALNRALDDAGLNRMPEWREGLARYFKELAEQPAFQMLQKQAREVCR